MDRKFQCFIGFTIIFWLYLYFLGFPSPMVDDLAFIGAAINLAEKGEFVNPLLSAWSEPTTDRFYVQPPFHSYTLAGWISLFGHSSDSLLLFQCICYCLFSIFTALILRKYQFSWLSIYCLPFVYALWMSLAGLRQDALGMAYLAIGLWGLIRDSIPRYFLGFIFLGLAICTSPILMAYAIPFSFGIAIANLNTTSKINWQYFLTRMIALIIAIITIFLLFLWAINFELDRFLSDLSWHASFRRVPVSRVIPEAIVIIVNGYGEIIYGSLYFIYGILLFLLLKKRNKTDRKIIFFTIILNFALALNLLLYVSTLVYNFNFFCSFGVVILLFNLNFSKRTKLILIGLCAIALLCYQSQAIVAAIGQTKPPQNKYESILNWTKEHPDRLYAVDEVAARFVFDYDFPENTIAWHFSNNEKIFWPTSIEQKSPREVWIISPVKAALTPDLPDYERVELFGHRFNSVPRSPYDVMLIK